MDANEYLKKIKPAAHRSRLAPFWNEITKLRQNNCTLDQVREFLAVNGVKISIAGLSNYIKRRGDHPLRRSTDIQPVGAGPEAGTPASNSAGGELPPSPQSQSDEAEPSLDEVLDAKQRDEKFDKYNSQNPLMKRKEKQK